MVDWDGERQKERYGCSAADVGCREGSRGVEGADARL